MAYSGDDPFKEFRQRLDRIELILPLTLLGNLNDEASEEIKGFVAYYLRRDPGDDRRSVGRDLSVLFSRLDLSSSMPRMRDTLDQFAEQQREMGIEIAETKTNYKNLNEDIASTQRKQDFLSYSVERSNAARNALSAELHEWLLAISLGADTDEMKLSRHVPARIYLDRSDARAEASISRAIEGVLDAIGFTFSDDFPAEKGSWFKKWFAKSKEALSKPEVSQRLEKLERAAELKGLGEPQAQIDLKLATAVAQLTSATQSSENAAIQIGSILFIKITRDGASSIQVKTLTQWELISLENNQRLLSSPSDILEKLNELSTDRLLRRSQTEGLNTSWLADTVSRTTKEKPTFLLEDKS